MKNKKTTKGTEAVAQAAAATVGESGGGVATMLAPPGTTSPQTPAPDNVLSVIQQFDAHAEADRQAIQTAIDFVDDQQKRADAHYLQASETNAEHREQLLNRMDLLTGKMNGTVKVVAQTRTYTKKTKAAKSPKVKVVARGGPRQPVGERDTDKVLAVIQKLKGKHSNSEVAEAVLKKHPDMKRQRIDAALQSLRGRMVNGKQVRAFRVKVTGKPRSYMYQAI